MTIKLKQISISGAIGGQAVVYSASLGGLSWGNPAPDNHYLSGSDHIGNLPEARIIFDGSGHDHSGGSEGCPVSYSNLADVPSSFTPSAHKTSHQDGGSDEITVNGLSGVLAQPQTPVLHGTAHEWNQTDVMSFTNLSGTLAETQKIEVVVNDSGIIKKEILNFITSSHININVWDDSGTQVAISASNLVGAPTSTISASLAVWADAAGNNITGTGITVDGSDNIDVNGGNITSVGTVDGVDVSSHASRHISGGADFIIAENLGTDSSLRKFIYSSTGGSITTASFRKYEEEITSQNVTGTDTVLTNTLTYTPDTSGSVQLSLNGLLQRQGASKDYILTGANLQQVYWLADSGTAVDLETNDRLLVTYNTFEETSIIDKLHNVMTAEPLSLWHVDYGVDLDVNLNVTGWNDQWGNNTMSQTTVSKRPYFYGSGSDHYIEFAGPASTEQLQMNNLSSTATPSDWILLIGHNLQNNTDYQYILETEDSLFGLKAVDASDKTEYAYSLGNKTTTETAITGSQIIIFLLKGGTNQSRIRRNGIELTPATDFTYVATEITGISNFGASYTGGSTLESNVKFFAMYKGTFDDEDLAYIEDVAMREMNLL
ncbi:MAG: hypothetical protein FK734_10690 [Asgard group archaeon]|nr:hypothetical protein [Asgard group archaeon]